MTDNNFLIVVKLLTSRSVGTRNLIILVLSYLVYFYRSKNEQMIEANQKLQRGWLEWQW